MRPCSCHRFDGALHVCSSTLRPPAAAHAHRGVTPHTRSPMRCATAHARVRLAGPTPRARVGSRGHRRVLPCVWRGSPSPSTSTGCMSAAPGTPSRLAGGSCRMLKPATASAGAAAFASAAPACASGAPSERAASADQTSLARLSTPSATRSSRTSAQSHAKTASPPASPPARSSNPTAARRARPPLALSTRDCSALLTALTRRLLASSGASTTFCA